MANNHSAIGFATGSGRCGTYFIAKLFDQPGYVASHHERCPLNDTFHRYCKWYGINVDPAGFLEHRRQLVEVDCERAKYSFEASPFLAFSIDELLGGFNCRIVVLMRDPVKVVASYLAKDWYANSEIRQNVNLPPTFQRSRYFHHFLGRISPIGDEFLDWNKLSRVGKLAWYWTAVNERLLHRADASDDVLVVKIEELTFDRAVEIRDFLHMPGTLERSHYESLTKSKPNSLVHPHPPERWTDREWGEFAEQVSPLAGRLGYEIVRPTLYSESGFGAKTESSSRRKDLQRPTVPDRFLGKLRAALSVLRHGAKSPYVRLPEDIELLQKI